jgi:hypothetical protein
VVYLGFVLAKESAGRPAGYAWVGLFAATFSLTRDLCRAMGEAPLLAMILCAAWAGHRALRAWAEAAESQSGMRALRWFAAAGFLGGAAGAAKLNGLAVVPAGAVLCLIALYGRRWFSLRRRLALGLGALVLLIGVAALTFVALNPYLYPDPVGRTRRVFWHRVGEMATQQSVYPDSRMPAGAARVVRVADRLFVKDATFPQVPVLNLMLSVAGLMVMLNKSWHWLRQGCRTPAPLVVLVVMGMTAAPALLTPLDWGRYFLLPTVFGLLCMAVAIGWGATALRALLRGDALRAG